MTNRASVTAVVLAGGRSERFGGPKLAVDLHGRPLLVHAIRATAEVADSVVVAGPLPSGPVDAPKASVRFIADVESFAGPLAALAGVLATITTELAIVVGGDMPGLAPAVLAAMLDRLRRDRSLDAVLLDAPATPLGRVGAASPSRKRQVLPVALRVAAASSAAGEALRAGDRSLVRLVGRLHATDLPAASWLALDPRGLTVLDVDVPEDLERFRGPEVG